MGGAVSSFFGSSPPSAPNLQTYQPQYTGQADTAAWTAMNSINSNNPYLQNQPIYQQIESMGLNNPYSTGVQTAANTAGQQYTNLGTQGMNAGNSLNASAMALLPYVSQVENTAMDPQNALYNQQKTAATNAANVNNAAYGLTGPYAAGQTSNAVNNFNMNWQNNQLARQATGMSAAATGVGAAGQGAQTAQNVGTNAAANTVLGGTTPNTAYLSNLANMLNALNSYGTSQTAANANTQTAVSDFMNYLGLGAQQSNQQANLNQQEYGDEVNAANNQNSWLSSLVNSGLGVAGGLESNFGGSSSSGNNVSGNNTGTSSANNISTIAALASLFI